MSYPLRKAVSVSAAVIFSLFWGRWGQLVSDKAAFTTMSTLISPLQQAWLDSSISALCLFKGVKGQPTVTIWFPNNRQKEVDSLWKPETQKKEFSLGCNLARLI